MTLTMSELDALERRFAKRRDSRPMVFTLAPDDPLTIGDLRRLIAMARRSIAPWQPIETAPKDGKPFLITTAGPEIDICVWNVERGEFTDYYFKQRIAPEWPYVVAWKPLGAPADIDAFRPPPPSMASEERKEDGVGSGDCDIRDGAPAGDVSPSPVAPPPLEFSEASGQWHRGAGGSPPSSDVAGLDELQRLGQEWDAAPTSDVAGRLRASLFSSNGDEIQQAVEEAAAMLERQEREMRAMRQDYGACHAGLFNRNKALTAQLEAYRGALEKIANGQWNLGKQHKDCLTWQEFARATLKGDRT